MKSEGFISFVKSFNKFETKTELVLSNNINYFINEFWTSKQRQGHSLHEISYRACFKSELPSFFIDKLKGYFILLLIGGPVLSLILYQCIFGVLTLISNAAIVFALIHQLLAVMTILVMIKINHKIKYI